MGKKLRVFCLVGIAISCQFFVACGKKLSANSPNASQASSNEPLGIDGFPIGGGNKLRAQIRDVRNRLHVALSYIAQYGRYSSIAYETQCEDLTKRICDNFKRHLEAGYLEYFAELLETHSEGFKKSVLNSPVEPTGEVLTLAGSKVFGTADITELGDIKIQLAAFANDKLLTHTMAHEFSHTMAWLSDLYSDAKPFTYKGITAVPFEEIADSLAVMLTHYAFRLEAEPLSLDTTFRAREDSRKGPQSIVEYSLSAGWDYSGAVVSLSDGRVVVAGTRDFSYSPSSPTASQLTFFDHSGRFLSERRSSYPWWERVLNAIQTSDGTIVTLGNVCQLNGPCLVMLRLYDEQGSPENRFTDNGQAVNYLDFGGAPAGHNEGWDLVEESSGKILIVGRAGFQAEKSRAFITRVNITVGNAGIDRSFGNNGYQYLRPSQIFDYATSIVLDENNNAMIAGTTFDGTRSRLFLSKVKSDGMIDSSFGNSGLLIHALGDGTGSTSLYDIHNDFPRSLVRQKDGKLLVGGQIVQKGQLDMGIARFHPNGQLDSSFGGDGLIVWDHKGKDDWVESVLLMPNGSIAAVSLVEENGKNKIQVRRFRSDGSSDPSVGDNGKVVLFADHEASFKLRRATLQADGQILIIGNLKRDGMAGESSFVFRLQNDFSQRLGFVTFE